MSFPIAAIRSKLHRAARATLFTTVACVAMAGTAHAAIWSTVGSAGTVDDDDIDNVSLSGGIASVSTALATSTVNVVYNIPQLQEFTGTKNMLWRIRYRDQGAGERVQLSIRQYNHGLLTPGEGTTNTLATFDSDLFAVTSGYDSRTYCSTVTWDFANGPFYLEAILSKSAGGTSPSLAIVELVPSNCTP